MFFTALQLKEIDISLGFLCWIYNEDKEGTTLKVVLLENVVFSSDNYNIIGAEPPP